MIIDCRVSRYGRSFVSRGSFRVVQPPMIEPISIDQAIAHLRLNPDDVDLLDLQAKITEARAATEDYIGRALAPQVLELATDSFPASQYDGFLAESAFNELELPMPPVIAIESVNYLDETGIDTLLELNGYVLDYHSQPAVVYLPYGATWPAIARGRNAVRIRYMAGYDTPGGSPDNHPLPPAILAAMKLMLGHLWENRELSSDATITEIPLGFVSLLRLYQTRIAMA